MTNVYKSYKKPINKIEAIFIDLDGTLLTSNKTITKPTILTLKKALDNGIEVYLISGRPYFFVSDIVKTIDPRCIPIGFNGAYYYLDDVLYHHYIVKNDFNELMSQIKQCNIGKYYIKSNTTIYCSDDDSRFTYNAYALKNDIKVLTNVSDINIIDTNIYKVLIIDTNEKLALLKSSIKANLSLTSSHNQSVEVMANNVDKGNTIATIATLKGYTKQSLMAIGDGLNDYSMFDHVNVAVAMENANSTLKEKANYITLSNDEDGVAYAINEICF